MSVNNNIKSILKKLISFPSVTPYDMGCQNYIMNYLKCIGFSCYQFNNFPVSNFFAFIGKSSPLLVFAGHTDVVSVGDENQWIYFPFCLKEDNGMFYGRGVADMKGAIASMMVAVKRFIDSFSKFNGSIGFLFTSGEEGDQFHLGTSYVMKRLKLSGIIPDFCIVGEPSSNNFVGDCIKVGHRGSLNGELTLKGKQGHVAYPNHTLNIIHQLNSVLFELSNKKFDKCYDKYFPNTSFQATYIKVNEGYNYGNNVLPGSLVLNFNFRFSSQQNFQSLKKILLLCLDKRNICYSIKWKFNSRPLLLKRKFLLDVGIQSVKEVTNNFPYISTYGGISDSRFIACYGVDTIELGLTNRTIHQINERVSVSSLEVLVSIYFSIMKHILLK
ncbi:succinyl-diaminopimelate desuccinylase [Candidatus Legionella polyplacis]|uniref:Succinyl-diaminopimelate desuccinylase n=1 Tax=Candidatus Legionella polyplacis TaxID=2005262 RepID=A0ABZ2GVA2_9GAMM|nr:succinyl-diaminopimelate desuccinylase [Candidatus Legionella polyplacis]ATW01924.1 succinyl-diaminopimelate desuccinylase [Candidatus Legionella polyplacis]